MPKKIPSNIVNQIKFLRKRGLSISEIKKTTKVSHGSAYRYSKNIQILPEYRKIWQSKRGGSTKRKKMLLKKASSRAKKIVPELSEKEKIIYMSALYWGEGNKKDFSLSNTDPELIKVFVKILTNIFKIPKNDFRVTLRIYEDLDKNKCLNYWSKIIGIPPENFVNVNVLTGRKKGKLSYGMCRVRIKKGGNMLKYIKAINNQVTKCT